MLLTYQLNLGGLQAVSRGLRTIERRVAAINRAGRGGIMAGSGVGGRRGAAGAGQAAATQRTLNQRMAMEEQRHQNKLSQIHARGNQARIRDAQRAAHAEERIARRSGISMEQYKRRVHGSTAGGMLRGQGMGRTGQSIRSGLRTVGTAGAGLLAIGGGFAIAGAIGQEKRLQASAAALANQARGTEGGLGKSFEQLKRESMSVARIEGIKSGQGPEAVIGAQRQFQAITGRHDIAQQMTGYMTELADATDAGLGDVGRTAGQIFQAIEATGKPAQESMEATMKIMDAMAGQSKIGSIEMGDLAKEMGKLMSATSRFKGDIGELAGDMGAMAQTAVAGGASSAAEAMTSMMNFAADLTQRGAVSPAYKRLGIDVFEREMIGGKEVRAGLKAPTNIIKQIVDATKGDIALVQSLFGKRAAKAVDPFALLYREAEKREAGTGLQAVQGRFEKFRAVSLTAPQRKEAATNRRRQADRQLDRAMQQFNNAVGQELLPVVTQLIPEFTKLIPLLADAAAGLGQFVSWFAENPVVGIGAIISAAIVKDIAAASIGSALRGAIVGGGGGGVGGAGGGAGGGLALTAALIGLTLAVDQANKLASEAGEFKSEAQLERERLMAGKGVGKTTLRARDFKEKARSVLGGLSWESTAADLGKLWGEDEELLTKGVDKAGKVRVTAKAYRGPEETISVPMSRRHEKPYGEMTNTIRMMQEIDEQRTPLGSATGERVSPAQQAAMPTLKELNAAAAAMKEAAVIMKEGGNALKESAAGLNRTDAPSPTSPR